MKIKKEDRNPNKNTNMKKLMLFLLVFLLIMTFSFQYYTNLHKTIREESSNYLHEITVRIGSNIDRIISDNYAVLHTMSATLQVIDPKSLNEIQMILKAQQKPWNYQDIMLIDQNGNAYNMQNKDSFMTVDDSMRENILNKKETMSTTQIVNNKECIIFSVPIQDLTVDGRTMVALAASYSPEAFEQVLSMTSFDEQAYSQIVTKSGSVVTRTSSPYAINAGYNVFASIKETKMDEGDSLEKVINDITNKKDGRIGFMSGGIHRYMVYTAINMNDWYLLTFVPVKAVNGQSDLLLKITIVLCGLITLSFAGLTAGLIQSFRSNKRKLEQLAYVDDITGGNTIQRFYELAKKILDSQQKESYALVYTNIEKFKVLNEQIGRLNCDNLLWRFNKYISGELQSNECMGRLSADNFCMLLEFTDEKQLFDRFKDFFQTIDRELEADPISCSIPVTEFGVYVIDNNEMLFPLMIDRAKLSLRESLKRIDHKIRVSFYDDQARKQLVREKQLEDMMQEALDNREFQTYLQPKYLVREERIGGAEALVRWISPEEGMIYPNEFIPLFEKNGFIIPLDLWVFEDVCRLIREWIDKDWPVMKISVNCSRVHLGDRNFLVPYCRICDQYRIPRQYIEIELTENIVLENVEQLTKVIDDIHTAGFGCSMDDFGSGYSSLNLIQSIPVDTLKLDKIFFKGGNQDLERMEAVVGSIVGMAKALHMSTVAEGVEYREQVDMLKKVGCNYIQGFVFAKPMKTDEFEKLAFNSEAFSAPQEGTQ